MRYAYFALSRLVGETRVSEQAVELAFSTACQVGIRPHRIVWEQVGFFTV